MARSTFSRRDLFRLVGRRVRDAVEPVARGRLSADRRTLNWLRPPGWTGRSTDACKDCHACTDACPPGAILERPDGTPSIDPERIACALCDDVPCAAACPADVLEPLPSAEVRMALAVVDPVTCRHAKGEACTACYTACPLPGTAMALVTGGPTGPRPAVLEEGCTGCGTCLYACPERPRAIRMVVAAAPTRR